MASKTARAAAVQAAAKVECKTHHVCACFNKVILECPDCNGKGYLDQYESMDGYIRRWKDACEYCNETGKIIRTIPEK